MGTDGQRTPITTANDIRTHRRRARHRAGRTWLCIVFVVLCPPGALLIWAAIHSGQRHFIGIVAVVALWITGLLSAIWVRYAWARYVLMLILISMAVAACIAAAAIPDFSTSIRLALICGVPFYMIALGILLKAESIWDLVSRAKD